MNGTTWTSLFTLAAKVALVRVDISQVGIQGDGLEFLASLHALATTDATVLALFHGQSTLVLVVAKNDHATALGTYGTQLDNASRTRLCTSATTRTLRFVHLGDASFRIHADSAKQASMGAIPFAQTTIQALGFAHSCHVLDAATVSSVELHTVGTSVTSTGTANYSHLGSCYRTYSRQRICQIRQSVLYSAWQDQNQRRCCPCPVY